jgi:hypothetical protein
MVPLLPEIHPAGEIVENYVIEGKSKIYFYMQRGTSPFYWHLTVPSPAGRYVHTRARERGTTNVPSPFGKGTTNVPSPSGRYVHTRARERVKHRPLSLWERARERAGCVFTSPTPSP